MDNDVMQKLQEHDKRFDRVEQRLDGHDRQFDAVINKLLEHDEEFTKVHEEIGQFRHEYLDGQDKMMRILDRLDHERVFTNFAISRLQEDITNTKEKTQIHEREIEKIKVQLHLR